MGTKSELCEVRRDEAGGRWLAGGDYRYYRYYNLDLITTREQMLTRHVLLLETTGRPDRPSLLFDLLRTCSSANPGIIIVLMC